MVRLNKEQLPQQQLTSLFSQLNRAVSKQSAEQANAFFSELLGDEEQIMLAKRLAVIVMIHKGYSLYRISRTIKVSSATANKISKQYEKGMYAHLLQCIEKDKTGYIQILKTIDSILTVGGIMPHYGQHHPLQK